MSLNAHLIELKKKHQHTSTWVWKSNKPSVPPVWMGCKLPRSKSRNWGWKKRLFACRP